MDYLPKGALEYMLIMKLAGWTGETYECALDDLDKPNAVFRAVFGGDIARIVGFLWGNNYIEVRTKTIVPCKRGTYPKARYYLTSKGSSVVEDALAKGYV